MVHAPKTPREELYAARARKARARAWPVGILLVGSIGAAIWQEPRLWPKGHEMMQDASVVLVRMTEGNDRVRGFFTTLTGGRTPDSKVGLAEKLSDVLAR
ncbi:hypothetical protein [Roseovarius autotrophicus]|uniref:hypothetical protein n=1 Tax=Roseovarius autotrophicus TaxID=2824121 RepID=UPI001B36EEEF|nr:hypothetical protein [Roseovarius autotrophicus]